MENSKDLSSLNSFGLPVMAHKFKTVKQVEDVIEILDEYPSSDILVLGGGSNILFTKNYPGLIMHNQILGRHVVEEDDSIVQIKVGAGENWHELVLYCISQGWGGIENLSLIPGSVGAAPIQNIGAYGVELKDVFHSLEYLDYENGEIIRLTHDQCNFGYRDSIFKRDLKGKGMILWVYLTLSKVPEVNIVYGAIKTTLNQNGITNPSIKDVSDAVIAIRKSKLPDPSVIGNAGSFFKNPVVNSSKYESLVAEYPEMPGYKSDNKVKIPAGWLIETAGWKGYTRGNIGVHKDQALVLVNHGGGSGKDLHNLSIDIKKSVFKNFGISLETEVNIL